MNENFIFSLNLSYSDYVILPTNLNRQGSTFLVDTQADISIVKFSAISEIFNLQYNLNRKNIINIKGITNDTIQSLGSIEVKIFTGKYIVGCTLHVVPDEFNIPSDGILGKNFIKKYKCIINYDNLTLSLNIHDKIISIPIQDGPDRNNIILPARCESIRRFELNIEEDSLIPNQEIAPGIFIPNTIVSKESPFIQVMNTNTSIQKIPKNTSLKAEPLKNFSIYHAHETYNNIGRTNKLINVISQNVNEENKLELLNLIKQFSEVFQLEDDKMTVNNFYQQKLRITDNTPVYIKNYRTPYSQKQEINNQTGKLLKNDLIEPSTSNYNSPVILIPKKGVSKKWRMCIDYRLVNKKLIADKYPLPRIEDILDNLGRAKFFSVLDLYSGFHQIPLHEDSRDITSFSTENGSFRWKVLPFGLNVSPNSFSRMMALAFAGVSPLKCFLYIDDIIVIGCSEKHHLKNLKAVFETCRKYNLKLNPDKCKFFKSEVTYLGHKCTDQGILPDNSKFKSIQNYPVPQDKDSVKRFVAFMNYYRRFIPHFAEIAKPLNHLSKLKTPFKWTISCQNSFQKLKKSILN